MTIDFTVDELLLIKDCLFVANKVLEKKEVEALILKLTLECSGTVEE